MQMKLFTGKQIMQQMVYGVCKQNLDQDFHTKLSFLRAKHEDTKPMSRKDRRLVADEPAEFENQPVEV